MNQKSTRKGIYVAATARQRRQPKRTIYLPTGENAAPRLAWVRSTNPYATIDRYVTDDPGAIHWYELTMGWAVAMDEYLHRESGAEVNYLASDLISQCWRPGEEFEGVRGPAVLIRTDCDGVVQTATQFDVRIAKTLINSERSMRRGPSTSRPFGQLPVEVERD